MRYSLKTLLIAFAFVPMAIMAVIRPDTLWVDAVCGAAVFAVLLAVLAALFTRAATRASATGYLLFAATYGAALFLAPDSLPAKRIVENTRYRTLLEHQRIKLHDDLQGAQQSLEKLRLLAKDPTPLEAQYEKIEAKIQKRLDDDASARGLLKVVHSIFAVAIGACGAILAHRLYVNDRSQSAAQITSPPAPTDPAAMP
jgi:hypothetical protein